MLGPFFKLWSRMTPLRLRCLHAINGFRVSRNQWTLATTQVLREQMGWSWDEIRQRAPDYFKRLEFSVKHARGRVLEIGCGVGTMTRWLNASDKVSDIVAIDAFEQALVELRNARLHKVRALRMPADELRLPQGEQFDTVMLCEIIEHLYDDEELELLARIRPHLSANARYVVSTPIGWLEDPTHVRAFGKRAFRRRLEHYYGPVQEIDYSSGYSQAAWGWWNLM